MPTQTLRGGRGTTSAGVKADLPGSSRLSSTTMHFTPLPTPVPSSSLVQPPPVLHGAPDLVHEVFTRRHSEADVLGAHATPPWQYTLIHQVAPAMRQLHPERPSFSLAPSSSQSLCTGFTEVGTDGCYLPDQLPTPSGSQEDSWMSVSSMTPSPEPFSVAEPDAPEAPSQTADHLPPQNDIWPASPTATRYGTAWRGPGGGQGA
ncbi:hypothetical protein EDB87DRAFT_677885 [Lactarius vividus]|nr:hypothetical protein EDB87DRAFT_677885 [Lactarius vividus]